MLSATFNFLTSEIIIKNNNLKWLTTYFYCSVLVTAFKETILAECADMIRSNETTKLLQMYKEGLRLLCSYIFSNSL